MKKLITLVGIAFMIILGINFLEPVVYADVTISQYNVDVTVDDSGNLTQKEEITYNIKEHIEEIKHIIGLGEGSTIDHLSVAMRSANSTAPFVFAEGTENAIGTYTISKSATAVTLDLHNTMEKEKEIATYSETVNDAWIKYGNNAIMQMPFLSAPFDVKQAQITYHFPTSVPLNNIELLVTGTNYVQSHWTDDKTLVLNIKNKSSENALIVQMYMPATVLSNIKSEGPESKGNQIVSQINDNKAIQNRQLLLFKVKCSVAAILCLCLLLIILFLLKRQRNKIIGGRNKKQQRKILPKESAPINQILSLCNKRTHHHDTIWLMLFSLVSHRKIIIDWVYQNNKELLDARITLLDTQSNIEGEQVVLETLSSYAQQSVLSFADFKYGEGKKESKRKKTTKRYKKLVNALIKQTKQEIKIQKQVNRGQTTKWYMILTLYIIITILLCVWSGRLMWEMNRMYWLLAVYVFCLVIVGIVWKSQLPVLSRKGMLFVIAWRNSLKQLPKRELTDFSDWEHVYLYSWITNKQMAQSRILQKLGEQTALSQCVEPLESKKLKDLI